MTRHPSPRYTYLGSQTNDFPPTLHPQVRTHDATYTCSQQLTLVVEKDRGIVVEPDEPPVWSSDGLLCANDDRATHVPPANLNIGGKTCRLGYWPRPLDHTDNFVTDAAPAIVDFLLQDVDALDEDSPRVVDDLEKFGKRQRESSGITDIERALEANHPRSG